MGDELTVSGGGAFAVTSDELHAARQSLAALASECGALARELRLIDSRLAAEVLYASDAPFATATAEEELVVARATLERLAPAAGRLGDALGLAIDGYGFAEAVAAQVVQDAAGTLASILGFALGRVPGLALLAVPLAPGVLGTVLGLAVRGGGIDRGINKLITDPGTVALVRLAIGSADEAAFGALGFLPPQVAALTGLGVVGLATVAGGAVAAGSVVGLTRETPVRLVSRAAVPAAPPSGWADRLERVPSAGEDEGTQVVIERYSTPGEPDRFGVFVGGTVTFGLGETGEPWDMTSNLGNAAGSEAASVRAVLEAMRLEGITADDPVQLTGYSQGGAVAAIIAASGDFTVDGLVTFGGNTGHVPIPPDIPTVIVEHADDLVPATSGPQRNTQAVLVERQAFAGGRELPDLPAPAHQKVTYAETAALMDAASSRQITSALADLDRFSAGAEVTRTSYQFVREG